ncbi:tetratricopeptide repeat protein [Mongoliitalea daihaiensis]|uniref:tetratricopeptide repeat protein n=1 Tax=Mongoliitalea daihaiensis TaxID=2782006 RepID=UPI001F2B1DEB|nr:tetratricopeptide repeat protein [Mongoliitalea daihaiensis]UJP65911.1 tetratricopeptide repeat protein [Mongoliitalea daihaiensis]
MNKQYNISQEEFEQIESYILGTLNEQDRELFEVALQSDPILEAKLQEVKGLMEALEEGAFRASLEEFHQEIEPDVGIEKSVKSLSPWIMGAAAAIMLLILAAGWVLYPRESHYEKLFAMYYQEDPGLITAMSSESDYEFDRAMVDYKSGNYQEAISRWESLIQYKPENDTIQYFLGVSHLALKKADPAIFYFDAVATNENSQFQKDAVWYLALAYVLGGKEDRAVEVLRQTQDPQAIELLKELTKK